MIQRSIRWLLPALVLILWSIGAWAQTVATDQSDYAPGEVAKITGSGFHPYEKVTLRVTYISGGIENGEGHEPWQITADENGNFVDTWFVDPDDSLGSTLKLTADCEHAGPDPAHLHAETVFTDGPKVGSVTVSA